MMKPAGHILMSTCLATCLQSFTACMRRVPVFQQQVVHKVTNQSCAHSCMCEQSLYTCWTKKIRLTDKILTVEFGCYIGDKTVTIDANPMHIVVHSSILNQPCTACIGFALIVTTLLSIVTKDHTHTHTHTCFADIFFCCRTSCTTAHRHLL